MRLFKFVLFDTTRFTCSYFDIALLLPNKYNYVEKLYLNR